MDIVNLILLAILPPIGLLYFIKIFDKRNKRKDNVWSAFVIGIIIAAPIGYIGQYVNDNNIILDPFIKAFILAALLEESFKFFSFKFFFYDKNKIFEPLDCVLIAGAISLGFATTENLLYVINIGIIQSGIDGGYAVALSRMFTAIPGHASLGIIMGYVASTFKFGYRNQTNFIIYVLGVPVIIHGLYNFFIFQNDSAIYSLIVLVLSILFSYRALKIQKANSPDEILNFDKEYNSFSSFISDESNINKIIYKGIIYLIILVLFLLTWVYILNFEFFQSGFNIHLLFIFLFPLLVAYNTNSFLFELYTIEPSIKNKAISYLKKGNALYRENKFKDAIEYYTYALKIDFYFPEAYKNRALSKKGLGDSSGYRNDYSKFQNLLNKKNDFENFLGYLLITGLIVLVLSITSYFFDIRLFSF